MSAARGPRATFRHDGAVAVSFPFDRGVVDDLKHQIPPACRNFDPDEKEWIISIGWAQVAIEILRAVFGHVEVEQGQPSTPTPIRKTDPDFAALHLLPSAPAEVVRAAYRALAKANHPDRGGSTAQMQAVNAAFEKLQDRGVA